MRKIKYFSGGDFVPAAEPWHTVQCECHHCGRLTAVATDKDTDYDRSEADYWEHRYRDLMGEVNTKISKLSREHGFNPLNEIFIRELAEIRDRLAAK